MLALGDDTLPASHAAGAVAPAEHAAPAGHAAQSAGDVAFATPFHVPAAQSSATAAPASQ